MSIRDDNKAFEEMMAKRLVEWRGSFQRTDNKLYVWYLYYKFTLVMWALVWAAVFKNIINLLMSRIAGKES